MIEHKYSNNAKRTKKYEIVMDVLRETTSYTKVQDLCKRTPLSKHEFAQSVSVARRKLAQEGIIIVNKHGEGYKVGNQYEFVFELAKPCLRAFSTLAAKVELAEILYEKKCLSEISIDHIKTLHENMMAIKFILESPKRTDYKTTHEFMKALAEYETNTRIESEYHKNIAHENVT